MNLSFGLIIWLIVFVVLAVLCFIFWKVFLCSRTGYENKKKEMAWGVVSIFVLFVTLLFIPLVFKSLDSTMISVAETLKENTVYDTDAYFREHEEEELTNIIDQLIKEQHVNMTEELKAKKDFAIATSLMASRNRQFIDTISTTIQLFTFEDKPILRVSEEKLKRLAYYTVLPYGEEIRNYEVKNKIMKFFFGNILDTTSFGSISGVEDKNLPIKAEKAMKRLLSNFYIVICSIMSLIFGGLLFIIIFLLKEPKKEFEETYERLHMFEFNRPDKITGKRVMEEINKFN